MRRREFIAGLGATGCPVVAWAQQSERVRRVAVLAGGAETDPEQSQRMAAFRQGLAGLGWTEGRNITIDSHYTAGESARTQAIARELIDSKYEVILAATTSVVAALRQATRTVPIVFVIVSDPIGSGFVESLPRPGGNVTGFINIEGSLGGKWLGLLNEIAPHLKRVAMMFNPETAPQSDYYLRPLESAARLMGVEPIVARVRNETEIEESIAALGREPRGGLIVMPDFFASVHRKQIISQAARHRVPTIYPFRFFTSDDGLISYGVDLIDLYRQAAVYVDRILKGEKPADLPVQAPTKFELILNLKTAKALGLDISPMLLGRADEVIE